MERFHLGPTGRTRNPTGPPGAAGLGLVGPLLELKVLEIQLTSRAFSVSDASRIMWSPNRAQKSIKTSTTNKRRRLSESSSGRTSAESLKKSEADFQYLLEPLSVERAFPSFRSEELDVKPEYIHFLFPSYHPSCPLIGGGRLIALNKSCPGDPPPAVLKADGPTGPEFTEDGSAQECAASLRLHGSLR